jgi:hypothetical protein
MTEQQGLRTIKRIPPLDFHDLPLDVHLHIQKEREGYEIQVIADGRFNQATVKVTPYELEKLNQRLQNEMQVVTKECIGGMVSPSEELVHSLAKVGYYAFKRIFGRGDVWIAIQKLLECDQGSCIQIFSDCFFLPWELIYSINPEETALSYENFWGMKYIISRCIQPGNRFSPSISIARRPSLGLLTYHRLLSVSGEEVSYFEKLASDGKIVLVKLPALHTDRKQEAPKIFERFWRQDLHLVHFACHTSYDRENPNLSYILLLDEFSISLEDLDVYLVEIDDNNPLIIMNACGPGALNPLYIQEIAKVFLKHGARGVVVAECNVSDTFATDFFRELYSSLLEGRSLGESLLVARRHFLERGNPFGLLYSMYAPPSTRLQRK